jgi:hypothetical protein
MKQAILIFLLLSSIASFGQQEKMKHVQVKLRNETSGLGIKDVRISTSDNAYSFVTERKNIILIRIPKSTDSLVFDHKNYFSHTIGLKPGTRRVKVVLTPLVLDSNDLPKLKNSLTFSPLILPWGRLELTYERYIKTQFSLGVILKWYFKEQKGMYNKFTAYQASPFFRYYFVRKKSYGFYMQAKLMIAYFDFSQIIYEWDKYDKYSEDRFWTGGAGFAIGYNDVLGNSKHLILDMHVGFQILPLYYPYSLESDDMYKSRSLWWFVGGPGTIIEVRISIGGIF